MYGPRANRPIAGESKLAELDLFTLEGYLRHYRTVFQLVRDHVPSHRLLIVPTLELTEKAPRIGAFLDPDDPVRHDQAQTHVYKASKKHGVLASLDPRHVDDQVHLLCGELLKEFFPEIRSITDVTL